jgi:hypothetical protein
MKTKTTKGNWPERTIQIPSGEQIRLIADDPEDVSKIHAINSKNQEIGEIWFSHNDDNPREEEVLLITHLGLSNLGEDYTRQGIGEAIVRMVKENTDLHIVATCPRSSQEKADASHLIDLGPKFIIKMRELGLVENYCYDDSCMCDDGRPDYEEDYPEE